MELSRPFIRLPFRFDAPRLAQELAQFEPSVWMAHPNRMDGNSAVPLISLNGGDNDDFAGHMQPSQHLAQCNYTQQVMASFGEVLARSRFMRLGAGAQVTQHVDFNYHWYSRVRIHIPVVTNPGVTFFCGDESIHMQAGECWIFDSWRQHKVLNQSDHSRVHLVIDTAGSSRFWKLVNSMNRFGPEFSSSEFESQITDIDYIENASVTIKTERFNVAPVMAPGELEAIANELMGDIASNPENNRALVNEYKMLLDNLAKDWREVWSQYGYDSQGFEQYRALLNRTVQQLRPNPRALVTASNNLGVNPIIMQRILRAALNVDQRERFQASD